MLTAIPIKSTIPPGEVCMRLLLSTWKNEKINNHSPCRRVLIKYRSPLPSQASRALSCIIVRHAWSASGAKDEAGLSISNSYNSSANVNGHYDWQSSCMVRRLLNHLGFESIYLIIVWCIIRSTNRWSKFRFAHRETVDVYAFEPTSSFVMCKRLQVQHGEVYLNIYSIH